MRESGWTTCLEAFSASLRVSKESLRPNKKGLRPNKKGLRACKKGLGAREIRIVIWTNSYVFLQNFCS